MADQTAPEEPLDPRTQPAARRGGAQRPLLALAALVPLALAVGAVATAPSPAPHPVEHAAAQSQPGASTRWCHGPLELPEGILEAGPDAELAITPPDPSVALRTVSVEPASSLLFGRVSASKTLQDEDGSVRAPSIAAETVDGTVLADDPASQDLGVSVLDTPDVEGGPQVISATAEGGRPVTDTVQSTLTGSGDYRSLALTRCAEPVTDASFLGVSTGRGDSAVLVLRNPSERPATASVQLWTQDGPAAMEGRSQVVVAPGEEQRVLLESVAPGQDAVGVGVSVLGAPLSMYVQSTERDGLTPGGAEILAPLPAAGTELTMPGVEVAGSAPTLVLGNSQGSGTTASVEVVGPEGPVPAAAVESIDLPAGTVVSTPLEGLPDGTYAVIVRSETPVTAVTRSQLTGADLPGDTIGAPVDFTLISPAPAIGSHAMSALPGQGEAGTLTLSGSADSAVTVIPMASDGSAGEPVSVDVAAGATAALTSAQLQVGDERAAGITIVPEVPGVVHAGWTQRGGDGTEATLLSSTPVLPARSGQDPVTVRLSH
ncbi:hypothetical protein CFK39_02740 [Brachybacterium avium]|uniref:Large extracellular alpha-helical protein n=1 Tax=Brachybacterium avium TaxID=2017485 RepID=A0A220U9W8_9MICO|nr:DUF5719 family protein [Brachybacterium avium]ASK64928.1 hypothetical protein CFK39_02740 [Brachybacterium avium]